MNFATFHFKKLTFFSLLSFADLFLTYQLVQKTGGSVYESNPIANAWLSSYGWVGLVIFKFIAMSVLMCAAMLLAMHRPHVAGEVLTFACFAVGGVVVYSGTMMNRLRLADEERRPLNGPMLVYGDNTEGQRTNTIGTQTRTHGWRRRIPALTLASGPVQSLRTIGDKSAVTPARESAKNVSPKAPAFSN